MMRHAKVTFAGQVRSGDAIRDGEEFVTVTKIRRAQGRKPKVGENLHIVVEGDRVLRFNSVDPVRVIRGS